MTCLDNAYSLKTLVLVNSADIEGKYSEEALQNQLVLSKVEFILISKYSCFRFQRRIQEFKKGGSFERVRENFGVTMPTFAKPCPFLIKTHLRELYEEQITSLHAR